MEDYQSNLLETILLPATEFSVFRAIIMHPAVQKTGFIQRKDFLKKKVVKSTIPVIGNSTEGKFYYILVQLTKKGVLLKSENSTKNWGEIVRTGIIVKSEDSCKVRKKFKRIIQPILSEEIVIPNQQMLSGESSQNSSNLAVFHQIIQLPNGRFHEINLEVTEKVRGKNHE